MRQAAQQPASLAARAVGLDEIQAEIDTHLSDRPPPPAAPPLDPHAMGPHAMGPHAIGPLGETFDEPEPTQPAPEPAPAPEARH